MGDWVYLHASPFDHPAADDGEVERLRAHRGRVFEVKNVIPLFWLAMFQPANVRVGRGRERRADEVFLCAPAAAAGAALDARRRGIERLIGDDLTPLLDAFSEVVRTEFEGFVHLHLSVYFSPTGSADQAEAARLRTLLESIDGWLEGRELGGDQADHLDAYCGLRDGFRARANAAGLLSGYAPGWPPPLEVVPDAVRTREHGAGLVRSIREVLERRGATALFTDVAQALERSPDRSAAEVLLCAAHPAPAALLASVDGVVRLRHHAGPWTTVRIEVRPHDHLEVGAVPSACVCVADGDPVALGARLTNGGIGVRAILDAFGLRAARDHLIERLRALLGLSEAVAAALADPMLALVRVNDGSDGATTRTFLATSEWLDQVNELLIAAGAMLLVADQVVIGYPRLALHVDPPVEAFVARAGE